MNINVASFTLISICSLFFFSSSYADTNKAIATQPDKMLLSQSGKRRMEKNLLILDQNLKDTQNNIEITKANIETLRKELKELDELEKEHSGLREKYQSFIAKADKEIEKNSKALKELVKYEREVASAQQREGATPKKEQFLKAVAEREQREKWGSEAETKRSRIIQLQKSLAENIRTIQGRKAGIENQLKNYLSRQRDYEEMILQITSKKNEAERLSQGAPEKTP